MFYGIYTPNFGAETTPIGSIRLKAFASKEMATCP